MLSSCYKCLLYLALGTRPDIVYYIILLARFTINPSLKHRDAIINIFNYFNKSKDLSIIYIKDNNINYISGYYDADYASDLINAKLTSSYVFLIANRLITLKSKL
jgi:hypothetical protein